MIKADIEKYKFLLNEYIHSIPIIYSIIEGQYTGEFYIDNIIKPKYYLLKTPVNFYYVGGTFNENTIDDLDDLLFTTIASYGNEKEVVVFCPNQLWEKEMEILLGRHNGIIDHRNIYTFNHLKFENNSINNFFDKNITILEENNNNSKTSYPVAKLLINNKCVSYCKAFMIGKGNAELDVFTEADYRKKGYGKMVSIALIKELLKRKIEPCWSTWPYRIESQKLAISLGFEGPTHIKAFIWTEQDCGKVSREREH